MKIPCADSSPSDWSVLLSILTHCPRLHQQPGIGIDQDFFGCTVQFEATRGPVTKFDLAALLPVVNHEGQGDGQPERLLPLGLPYLYRYLS